MTQRDMTVNECRSTIERLNTLFKTLAKLGVRVEPEIDTVMTHGVHGGGYVPQYRLTAEYSQKL
jgi:hypothetical protein